MAEGIMLSVYNSGNTNKAHHKQYKAVVNISDEEESSVGI